MTDQGDTTSFDYSCCETASVLCCHCSSTLSIKEGEGGYGTCEYVGSIQQLIFFSEEIDGELWVAANWNLGAHASRMNSEISRRI